MGPLFWIMRSLNTIFWRHQNFITTSHLPVLELFLKFQVITKFTKNRPSFALDVFVKGKMKSRFSIYIWKTGFRLILKFEGKPWIPEQELFDLIVKNGPLLSHTFVGFCLTLAVEMSWLNKIKMHKIFYFPLFFQLRRPNGLQARWSAKNACRVTLTKLIPPFTLNQDKYSKPGMIKFSHYVSR